MTAKLIYEVKDAFRFVNSRRNPVIKVSISTEVNDRIYLQSDKSEINENDLHRYRNMAVAIEDIDDLVTALLYAKKLVVDQSWEPKDG